MTARIPEWIIPGTGASVLNGAGGLTESARLYNQVYDCCGPTGSGSMKTVTGNVSCCPGLRVGNSVQGTPAPPASIYLQDKLTRCEGAPGGPLSAAQARALIQQARSRANVQTEEGLLLNRVAAVIEQSTDPLSTSTRFAAYAGNFVPPACPPTPAPPTQYIPTTCPPPPGSKGF